jgi:hypothetical protein
MKSKKDSFKDIPDKDLIRREEEKVKKLIETAKIRGRILARQEWEMRSVSRSNSKTFNRFIKSRLQQFLNLIMSIVIFHIDHRPKTQERKTRNLKL